MVLEVMDILASLYSDMVVLVLVDVAEDVVESDSTMLLCFANLNSRCDNS